MAMRDAALVLLVLALGAALGLAWAWLTQGTAAL